MVDLKYIYIAKILATEQTRKLASLANILYNIWMVIKLWQQFEYFIIIIIVVIIYYYYYYYITYNFIITQLYWNV